MRSIFRLSLFLMVFFSFTLNLSAQEPEDDYLEFLLFMEIPKVITATLTRRDIIKAPSSMTVITEQQIKDLGCRSLMEIIDQQPGFNVTKNNYGFDLISIRGIAATISNDKVKMLINGHAITEAIWSAFSIFSNIPLENVQQIEIMRGPGSSLYGTNAYAAIINVITKDAEDLKPLNLDVKVESFDTKSMDTTYAYVGDNSKLVLNFNYFETDGDDSTIEKDALTGAPFSYAPAPLTNGATESRINIDYKYGNFSLTSSFFDVESQLPIGQNYLTQDEENQYYDYYFVEAKYNAPVSDSFNVIFKASVDALDAQIKGDILPDGTVLLLDLNGDGIPEPVDVLGNGFPEMWPGGAYMDFGYSSLDYKGEILFDYNLTGSNKLLFGLFFERTETNDVFSKSNGHPLYSYSTYPLIVDYTDTFKWNKEEDRDIWGLFFQDEWQLTEDFYLVLGARYDDYSDFGSTFNPRCALVWDFNHMGGIVKLIYSTAFKAPTFSQLYNQNNPSLVGNPNLDPENIESLEFSVNYIFNEKVQTSISLFSISTKDLIDISDSRDLTYSVPPFYYENKKDNDIIGSEIEAKYIFAERNYLFASYAYTDAEDSATNKSLPWIAENQATFGVNFFLKDMINININMDHTGELPREPGDQRKDLSATTTFDLTIRLEKIGNWDFYFSALNFTDEDIYSPAPLASYPQSDIPMAGDHYRIGASYKY